MILHVTRMGEEMNSEDFSGREMEIVFQQQYLYKYTVFQSGYSEGQYPLMHTQRRHCLKGMPITFLANMEINSILYMDIFLNIKPIYNMDNYITPRKKEHDSFVEIH